MASRAHSVDLRVGPAPAPALGAAALRAVLAPIVAAEPRPDLVVINDAHRDTATDLVLRELARHWPETPLLVATGSHKPEPLPFAPPWPHAMHDCRAPREGALDPRVLQARRLLAIGSAEPHYFAGVTGAHKTATIGVASYAAITENHRNALSDDAAPLRLGGNPVYEGIARMVDLLRPADLAVSLVQRGRRVLGAWAGPLSQAATAARDAAAPLMSHRLERRAAAVIAKVRGTLGRMFYQADKGIKNVEHAVADGGVIVLDASCADGVGPAAFMDLLRAAPDLRSSLALVEQRGYRLGDHKAVRLRALAARGVRVICVSPGLSDEDVAVAGFTRARSVAGALKQAGALPDGPIVEVEDAGNFVLTA